MLLRAEAVCHADRTPSECIAIGQRLFAKLRQYCRECVEAGLDVEIVLMDYHLPGLDGLETTRRIRAGEAPGRHVAIVGVTASASIADRNGCIAAGMDDYVPKPVSLADLSSAFARTSAIRTAVRSAVRPDETPVVVVAEVHPEVPEEASATPFVGKMPPDPGPLDPGPADPGPVVDWAVLDDLVRELGDRAIVVDLVDTFLGELTARIDGIATAGACGDRDGLHRLVHTLTSSARLLGAGRLATCCREFEAGRLPEPSLRELADCVRAEHGRWIVSI